MSGIVMSRRHVLFVAASMVTLTTGVARAASEPVAIKGYDPVAYFTDNAPKPGTETYALSWDGSRWLFASAEHRDIFKADPDKYLPQYGGYCSFGVAQGGLYESDPTLWTIVDGKLYLNSSPDAQKTWDKNRDADIATADKNWPTLK